MGNLIGSPEDEECEEYQEPEEEEEIVPFNITVLPPELIHKIVAELDYSNYVNLAECDRFFDKILNSREFSLHHRINGVYINKKTIKFDLPFHFQGFWKRIRWHVMAETAAQPRADHVAIECSATSGRIRAAVKLFKKSKLTTSYLRIMKQIRFTPDDFDQLVTAIQAEHLYSATFIPRDFFTKNIAINKLKALTLDTCGCTDEDLLQLQVPCVSMINDFITDRGLNRFLKQWKRHAREINWFQMEFGSSQGPRNYDRILEGLEANPLWSPAHHQDSMIARLILDDFPLATDPTHMYSIWRCDDLETIRMITLSAERIDVSTIYCEKMILLNNLTDDQHYSTFKSCKWCDDEFCCHRRWYSPQRFKRRFPSVYNIMIEIVKVASIGYTLAQYSQLLLGASPIHPRVSEDDVERIRHEELIDQSYWKRAIFTLWLYVFNY